MRHAAAFMLIVVSVFVAPLADLGGTALAGDRQDLLLTAADRDQHAGPGEILTFSLVVHNLSAGERTVALAYADFHGWPLSGPEAVDVPASSSVDVTFTVSLPIVTPPGNDFITVTATMGAEQASLDLLARITWFERQPVPELPLYAAVVYDPSREIFYVIGGNDNYAYVSGLLTYHPSSDTWDDSLAPPDLLVTWAGACLLEDRVYLVGGSTDFVHFTDALQIYDIANDAWTTAEPLGEPNGMISMAVTCDPDRRRVWVVAGMDQTYALIATVRYYDLAAETWTTDGLEPFPWPFYNARAIYHNHTLRTISGPMFSVYDISANLWTDDEFLPYEHLDTAYDRFGGYEVVVGGWRFGAVGDIVSDNSAIYRPLDGGNWEFQGLVLPEALGPTAGAFDSAGRFFVFGGLADAGYGGGRFSSDVYAYPFASPPDDPPSGERAETMLAYDDGSREIDFTLICDDCTLAQGFAPKLYPVRLLNFSWRAGSNSGSQYPLQVVVYHDEVADGVPPDGEPIYRSPQITAGPDNSWNSYDLSAAAELQQPIESGEIFIGFEFNKPNGARPFLGFDVNSAPVDRLWYRLDGQWESAVKYRKVGVMMMRVGIEFLGEIPDDDTADDDESPDDDSSPDDDTVDDDSADGDNDADSSDDDNESGCGCR